MRPDKDDAKENSVDPKHGELESPRVSRRSSKDLSLLKDAAADLMRQMNQSPRRNSQCTELALVGKESPRTRKRPSPPPRRGIHDRQEKSVDFKLHDPLEPGELLALKAFGSEVKVRFPGGVSAGRTVRLKRENGTITSELLPFSPTNESDHGDSQLPSTMPSYQPIPASPLGGGNRVLPALADAPLHPSTSKRQLSPAAGGFHELRSVSSNLHLLQQQQQQQATPSVPASPVKVQSPRQMNGVSMQGRSGGAYPSPRSGGFGQHVHSVASPRPVQVRTAGHCMAPSRPNSVRPHTRR